MFDLSSILRRKNGVAPSRQEARSVASNAVPFKAPSVRALIVDDNVLNQKVARRLLDLYGVSVDTALSGAAAIDAVTKRDYDLVFMDHMMPDMDGIETTAKIREISVKHKMLPIVALTANVSQDTREMFLSSGLDDYLPKPIELDKLSDILIKWIAPEKITHTTDGISAAKPAPDNAESADTSKDIWRAVSDTGFINSKIAVSRAAGSAEAYMETLAIFYEKLPQDREKCEEYLTNNDTRNFAITIHGLKSSLATIGAMRLSVAADELETAAKSEDRDEVEALFPPLREQLRELEKKLTPIINDKP